MSSIGDDNFPKSFRVHTVWYCTAFPISLFCSPVWVWVGLGLTGHRGSYPCEFPGLFTLSMPLLIEWISTSIIHEIRCARGEKQNLPWPSAHFFSLFSPFLYGFWSLNLHMVRSWCFRQRRIMDYNFQEWKMKASLAFWIRKWINYGPASVLGSGLLHSLDFDFLDATVQSKLTTVWFMNDFVFSDFIHIRKKCLRYTRKK